MNRSLLLFFALILTSATASPAEEIPLHVASLLDEVQANSEGLRKGLQMKVLGEVGAAKIKAGVTEDGLHILRLAADYFLKEGPCNPKDSTSSPDGVDRALDVAEKLRAANRLEERREVLGSIVRCAREMADINRRVHILTKIAVAHAGASEVDLADEAVEQVRKVSAERRIESQWEDSDKIRALLQISLAYMRIGNKQAARRSYEEAKKLSDGHETDRDDLTWPRGEALVVMEEYDEIYARHQRLGALRRAWPSWVAHDTLHIAQWFLNRRDTRNARFYLEKAVEWQLAIPKDTETYQPIHDIFWSDVALAFEELDDQQAALGAFGKIRDQRVRPLPDVSILRRQIREENYYGALETIRKLSSVDPSATWGPLMEIVKVCAKEGKVHQAHEALNLFSESINNFPLFREIKARHKTDEQHGDYYETLRIYASGLGTHGDSKEALRWARGQPSQGERVYALLGVAEGTLNRGTEADNIRH